MELKMKAESLYMNFIPSPQHICSTSGKKRKKIKILYSCDSLAVTKCS